MTEKLLFTGTSHVTGGSNGAILLEQNDEWAVQRARYMTLETIAR
jgi:hypothetical protein